MARKRKSSGGTWRVEKQLIRYVYEYPDITRAELAKRLGQSSAAISLIIRRLINQGWLKESGRAASVGGRRPVQLRLASGRAYVIGLDISPESVRSVLMDADGMILARDEMETETDGEASVQINRALVFAQKTARQTDIDEKRLLGIGLSIVGVVQSDTGVARLSVGDSRWETIDVVQEVEKVFPDKMTVADSRARTRLSYELYTNPKLREQTVILYDASYTLGCALAVKGYPYQGVDGSSIDPTMMPIGCYPSQRVYLGDVVSEPDILRRVQAAISTGYPTMLREIVKKGGTINPANIAHSASAGDQLSFLVLSETADALGASVAAAANMLRPRTMLFAGDLVDCGALLIDSIKRQLRLLSLPDVYEQTRITVLDPNPHAPAIGAAHLVLRTWLDELAGGGK